MARRLARSLTPNTIYTVVLQNTVPSDGPYSLCIFLTSDRCPLPLGTCHIMTRGLRTGRLKMKFLKYDLESHSAPLAVVGIGSFVTKEHLRDLEGILDRAATEEHTTSCDEGEFVNFGWWRRVIRQLRAHDFIRDVNIDRLQEEMIAHGERAQELNSGSGEYGKGVILVADSMFAVRTPLARIS